MNRLVAFLVLSVCAVPARAALVYDGYATGPGGFSTPYPAVNPEVYAGLIELVDEGGGGARFAMSSDRNTLSHVGEFWTMTNYSYADVQAGAPVRFTSAQYARAAALIDAYFEQGLFLSLRQGAEAYGNDALAQINTQVWDIMSSNSCPIYWSYCSSADTFNWSGEMAVASGGPGRDEYLVPLASQGLTLASGTVTAGPVVPLPPAAWLLGSGLLGLAGVARKRHKAPH